MKIAYALLLAISICSGSAWAQTSAEATTNRSELNATDKARLAYYMDIKEYVQRYAYTPASCSEIVEAALSANDEIGAAVLPTLAGWKALSVSERESLTNQLRETTRRWAMRVALEAKYPNPSIFQQPSSSDSQVSSTKRSGASMKK